MIKHVTEKETQLTNMLHTCTEALTQVTAERDKLAAELKALRDSGVELPFVTMCQADYQGNLVDYFTESQLRDYGDRRAAAERERAAKVCESTHANGNRKYTHADECAEAIHKGEKS